MGKKDKAADGEGESVGEVQVSALASTPAGTEM